MKRQASFVCPGTVPNATLGWELCKAFGGYTVTAGQGAWISPSGDFIKEQVQVYTVAMEPTWKNNRRLSLMVRLWLQRLNQHSGYIQYADGRVEIFEL